VILIFAHRGYTAGPRENTLEAFAEARRRGADGVELDVRRTADGTLVVHHDPVVPGLGPIADHERAELPPEVPTLGAALGACHGLIVNVEIKNDPSDPGFDPADEIAAATAAELVAHGTDSVFVSSFRAECLEVARRQAPGLRVGWLVGWLDDARVALGQAAERGYSALHPFVTQVDETLVSEARGAGVGLSVWTVNARADLDEMCRLGVDALITDQLEAAQAARSSAGRTGPRNGGGRPG
jgi:glycerophosphoryl diester phosphodiesterase